MRLRRQKFFAQEKRISVAREKQEPLKWAARGPYFHERFPAELGDDREGLADAAARALDPLGQSGDRLGRLRVGRRFETRVSRRRPLRAARDRTAPGRAAVPRSPRRDAAHPRRRTAPGRCRRATTCSRRRRRSASPPSGPSALRGPRPAARPAAASSRSRPPRAEAAGRERSRRPRCRAACRRRACPALPNGRRRGTARAPGAASALATSPGCCPRGRSRSTSASTSHAREGRSWCRRRRGAAARRACAGSSGRRRRRRGLRRARRARPAQPRDWRSASTCRRRLSPTRWRPHAWRDRARSSSRAGRLASARRAPPSPPGS